MTLELDYTGLHWPAVLHCYFAKAAPGWDLTTSSDERRRNILPPWLRGHCTRFFNRAGTFPGHVVLLQCRSLRLNRRPSLQVTGHQSRCSTIATGSCGEVSRFADTPWLQSWPCFQPAGTPPPFTPHPSPLTPHPCFTTRPIATKFTQGLMCHSSTAASSVTFALFQYWSLTSCAKNKLTSTVLSWGYKHVLL